VKVVASNLSGTRISDVAGEWAFHLDFSDDAAIHHIVP